MEKTKNINSFISICILIAFITSISLGQLVFAVNINGLLLVILILLCGITCFIGYSFDEILEIMLDALKSSMSSLMIFILIGALVSSWIFSGSLPSMVYFGIEIISPNILLPTAFILCMITSIIAGTSWGTVSTIGVILVEIATSMDINIAVVAGAVISGACFGDKLSPMSDTTNLAAMSCDVPVINHIKSMAKTTIPTAVICLIFYAIYGAFNINTSVSVEEITEIQTVIMQNFKIDIIALTPIILTLIITFILRASAIVSFGIGVISACIVGVCYQGDSISTAFSVISMGFSRQTGNLVVDKLLNRGGIDSMMNVFAMSIFVICIGGILSSAGYLSVITKGLSKIKGNLIQLTTAAISTTAVSCMVTGDSYMPIIMTGRIYQKVYDKAKIPRQYLSRSSEDGATLLVPIIPWSITAIFFTNTLGVSTWEYIPFAMLCWLNPFISIIFSMVENKKIEKRSNI